MVRTRLFAVGLCLVTVASAQRLGVPTADLDKVSVEELFRIEVTSVGRKAQQMAKAPAAVFVLTAADIRRSGAMSIPEALQLVPGLTVMRMDGRGWIVSARGGARLYSDKMLVMIDGRSLYTPFFSGVMWDAIDLPLEDVEQIEIVRGPGAVMWGPNAVNGVINMITRNARTTKGLQTVVTAGNENKAGAQVRYGAAPSEKFAWRAWGKFDYLTPAFHSPGWYNYSSVMLYRRKSVDNLDSASGRVGFRMDGQPGEKDQWMMEGDLFKTDRQDPLLTPVLYPSIMLERQGHSDYLGGSLQGKWVHTSSPGNERTVLFSYDRTDFDYPNVAGNLSNLNANVEWRRQTGERNELYWGTGYQRYWDTTGTNRRITFNPRDGSYNIGSGVVRDEYQLIPGRLLGSAGLRVDYNSFHHLEYQPSLRLLYTPNARQSAWLAASRAVRAPNRLDRDFHEDAGVDLIDGYPVQLWMFGSKDMKSEIERSVEAGYRFQSGQRWSADASVFWSTYSRLRGVSGPLAPAVSFSNGVPALSSTVTTCNCGAGHAYGGELWATVEVQPGWRLIPSYAYLEERRRLPDPTYYFFFWDGTPAALKHQGILRSQHDLTRTLQFDLTLRARSASEALYRIPGTLLLDARLGWRLTRSGELSLTAHNLTGRSVMEGYPELANVAIPLRRTFVLKWTQRF